MIEGCISKFVKTFKKASIKLCEDNKTITTLVPGPNVRCKTNNIIFHCTDANPVERILQLENRGSMETIFQFDIDNKNSDVTISPPCGTIFKDETIDILLTYYPKLPVIVFRQIFCLLHYQVIFKFTFIHLWKLINNRSRNYYIINS